MIATGDVAPDFELESGTGQKVKLSDFRDKKVVVLFFYPRDGSPGCTIEACNFRDSHDVFVEAGAEVIGISTDTAASHAGFAKKHGLPMTLLADIDSAVRTRYGIGATLGLIPGRVTFVIDKAGVVRHVFDSQIRVDKHVGEALAVVRQLR